MQDTLIRLHGYGSSFLALVSAITVVNQPQLIPAAAYSFLGAFGLGFLYELYQTCVNQRTHGDHVFHHLLYGVIAVLGALHGEQYPKLCALVMFRECAFFGVSEFMVARLASEHADLRSFKSAQRIRQSWYLMVCTFLFFRMLPTPFVFILGSTVADAYLVPLILLFWLAYLLDIFWFYRMIKISSHPNFAREGYLDLSEITV